MAYVCPLPLSPAHASSISVSSSPVRRVIPYLNACSTIGRPWKYKVAKSPYFFGCSHGKNLPRRGLLKGIGATGILMCASVISEPPVQGMEKLPFKPEGYNFWTWRNHKIHYVVQGEGRPIVLIHGFGASAFHWRYNIPKLAKTFKVYAIDLLGFGWSEKALIDYNAFVWRDQVADFLNEIVKDPALLVGNSLGGFTALITAADCPEFVSGVALLNSAGQFRNPEEQSKNDVEETAIQRLIINPLKNLVQRAVLTFAFWQAKQPSRVQSVPCGPWHTAVVTSAGQLFTFGDGTFGVLGHGDRKKAPSPREVESLKGLRTVRAACGVWHTAAVVEVMVGSSSSSNCSSGKLFTWGDGDKGRLGHGDKEPRLVPTCVAALVEPNFRQVACGHSLTVALTTSGHVYTMGSPVNGQLGNPQADGKLPVRVEGKLRNVFVEDIACGAYHAAVLTSKTEVYTWGKGANGRLGHGDIEDRNSPTLVEALKDKQVKSVVCGSSFTAAICLHKWVSGVDQSMCSGCRLPFGFTRKRHNCYNCGLVFCHACSAKKSLKASLAPNPNKPYRVCDNCYIKLKKALEAGSTSHTLGIRRGSTNQRSYDLGEKQEKFDAKTQLQFSRFSNMESSKQTESRSSSRRNRKLEFHSSRVSPVPNGNSQWGSTNLPRPINPVFGSSKKIFSASVPGSRIVSRASSPISRRPSPPRSATPTPTLAGLTSPKLLVDDAKKENDTLSQEVINLRVQVENLSRRSQLQEVELERTAKQLKEAIAIAGEETAKCKAAKEVIKSLTAQLKDMAEKLPGGVYRYNKPGSLTSCTSNGVNRTSNGVNQACTNDITVIPDSKGAQPHAHQFTGIPTFPDGDSNGTISPAIESEDSNVVNGCSGVSNKRSMNSNLVRLMDDSNRSCQAQSIDEAPRPGNRALAENDHEQEIEWVEQDEPGVYITLTSLPGGGKDLKRVRFSRKRFSERQAEHWWAENRPRVYEQYHVRIVDKASIGPAFEG